MGIITLLRFKGINITNEDEALAWVSNLIDHTFDNKKHDMAQLSTIQGAVEEFKSFLDFIQNKEMTEIDAINLDLRLPAIESLWGKLMEFRPTHLDYNQEYIPKLRLISTSFFESLALGHYLNQKSKKE